MGLPEIRIEPRPLGHFREILPEAEVGAAERRAEALRERLEGRALWNVNTTAVGGGVAEMLHALLRYARGAGLDARWVVIRGEPEFFRLTKRLHHALHGSAGDGSPLDARARELYEATLRENADELCGRVRRGDVVILHDPQTAGLAPHLRAAGARVLWRCHVGHDRPGPEVEAGWAFLAPYLESAEACVFSRPAYVPERYARGRSAIIRPSIDAFSPKNQALSADAVRTILVHAGLVEGPPPQPADPGFRRGDGSPGRVERSADVVRQGRAPSWETPLVVQVSRWDPLKDPKGVLEGFARLVDGRAPAGAELVLAGPDVNGVADDPEGARVLDEVTEAWRGLPHGVRRRVHLASLPTADVEENAAMVNALQRHAAVVVQKSLHEGFGLTVTEAMWKGRAVLASAVGGIRDQVDDGAEGLLLKEPGDLDAFASALRRLLEDDALRARLGGAARERVRQDFLGLRHLSDYAELLERLGV